MTLAQKRILYLSFFLVFFLVLPLILLATSGYRINFQQWKIEKTGTLMVATLPRKAEIFLNGKKNNDTTPARLRYIFPGIYQVRLHLDGFYDWTNEVIIQSNLVTFIEDIQLIRAAKRELIIQGPVDWYAYTDNNIFYSENTTGVTQINSYNLRTATSTVVHFFPGIIHFESQTASPDSRYLLIATTNGHSLEYFILDTQKKVLFSISGKTQQFFENVKWDQANSNILYGLRQNVLYRIQLSDYSITAVVSRQIEDFSVTGHTLYSTQLSENRSYLRRMNLLDLTEQSVPLPDASSYTLQFDAPDLISVFNQRTKKMYVLKTGIFDSLNSGLSAAEYLILADSANAFQINNKRDTLLVRDEFELSFFSIPDNKKELINRFSSNITKAQWAIRDTHIAYQLGTKIFLSDRPTHVHPQPNIYMLADLQSLTWFSLEGQDKTKLYFSGEDYDQAGLFRLDLAD